MVEFIQLVIGVLLIMVYVVLYGILAVVVIHGISSAFNLSPDKNDRDAEVDDYDFECWINREEDEND